MLHRLLLIGRVRGGSSLFARRLQLKDCHPMTRCAGFLISIVLPLAGQGPASDFSRGVQLQRSGDLQGARSAYEAALRSNPRSV
jgi:hypothetical protein